MPSVMMEMSLTISVIPEDPTEFQQWCQEYNARPVKGYKRAWLPIAKDYVKNAYALIAMDSEGLLLSRAKFEALQKGEIVEQPIENY